MTDPDNNPETEKNRRIFARHTPEFEEYLKTHRDIVLQSPGKIEKPEV